MDDQTVRRLEQLIAIGKRKGYILYDEIDDLPPEGDADGREIEDVLSELERAHVEILDEPKIVPAQRIKKCDESTQLEQTRDSAYQTDDPVDVYLRQVCAVPLTWPHASKPAVPRWKPRGANCSRRICEWWPPSPSVTLHEPRHPHFGLDYGGQ